jgi:GNAT superfamily N-acetyltransferase
VDYLNGFGGLFDAIGRVLFLLKPINIMKYEIKALRTLSLRQKKILRGLTIPQGSMRLRSKSKKGFVVIARCRNKIVGWGLYIYDETLAVFVHPDYRKKGVATEIVYRIRKKVHKDVTLIFIPFSRYIKQCEKIADKFENITVG